MLAASHDPRRSARAGVLRQFAPNGVLLLLLDGPAHERAAAWAADLITPAHAAAFTRLFEGAKDKKTLHAGVLRQFAPNGVLLLVQRLGNRRKVIGMTGFQDSPGRTGSETAIRRSLFVTRMPPGGYLIDERCRVLARPPGTGGTGRHTCEITEYASADSRRRQTSPWQCGVRPAWARTKR